MQEEQRSNRVDDILENFSKDDDDNEEHEDDYDENCNGDGDNDDDNDDTMRTVMIKNQLISREPPSR